MSKQVKRYLKFDPTLLIQAFNEEKNRLEIANRLESQFRGKKITVDDIITESIRSRWLSRDAICAVAAACGFGDMLVKARLEALVDEGVVAFNRISQAFYNVPPSMVDE